ncbi:hypothetical protein D3C72_1935470 [compost metagenome]
MRVGAQFEPFSPLVLASLPTPHPDNVAQGQQAVLVVRPDLHLLLALRVVVEGLVAAFAEQFLALVAGQGMLARQLPRRQVQPVIDRPDDDWPIRVSALVYDNDFLADARQVRVAETTAR